MSKSLLDNSSGSAEWRDRIADLSAKLANSEQAHRVSLNTIEEAAAKMAASVPGASRIYTEARKTAEDLAEQIAEKRAVLAAAQKALQAAQAVEAERDDAERVQRTAVVAKQVTQAAEEVEALVIALNKATSTYIEKTGEHATLENVRDHFDPRSRGKVRLTLQNYLRQFVECLDVPGSRGGKRPELLKPAKSGDFLG